MITIPFEAGRFHSTAEYYERFRVPYPDALIERVAERTGLTPGGRLIDLGCGPGQLAIAFARLAGALPTGIDPEPEMLEAARRAADAAGVEVRLMQGSSYDLAPHLGPARLVVMGRSFHWMDRADTLLRLDTILEPGGAVALFDDRSIAAAPDWRPVLDTLSQLYSPARNESRTLRRGPDWVPHESVLLASPFPVLERISRVCIRRLSADDIVGRAFSMSVTSRQNLGQAAAVFEEALRKDLRALSPDDSFEETVEVRALIAFRS